MEKDIRQHIAFENQLRIHIENLSGKGEEMEAERARERLGYEEEVAALKREKRRLDDLLTIREDELAQIRALMQELQG